MPSAKTCLGRKWGNFKPSLKQPFAAKAMAEQAAVKSSAKTNLNSEQFVDLIGPLVYARDTPESSSSYLGLHPTLMRRNGINYPKLAIILHMWRIVIEVVPLVRS